jgi:hypothetical protein
MPVQSEEGEELFACDRVGVLMPDWTDTHIRDNSDVVRGWTLAGNEGSKLLSSGSLDWHGSFPPSRETLPLQSKSHRAEVCYPSITFNIQFTSTCPG